MLFTKLGRIVAVGAMIFGTLRVATVLMVLQFGDVKMATAQYLGGGTTGEYMDKGIYLLVFGILVGILTDISKSLASDS